MNWDQFYQILDQNKAFFNSLQYTNQILPLKYELFVNFLHEAITESLPINNNVQYNSKIKLKGICRKTKSNCIWWNESCDKVVRQWKAAFKSIKYRFTMKKFIEVKRLDAKISPRTKTSEVWKTIRRFNNSFRETDSNATKLDKNMQESNTKLTSPKSISTNALHSLSIMGSNHNNTHDHEVLCDLFSYEEFQFVLRNINLKSVLLDLLNDIYNSQYFPPDWNNYLVLFIPKGNSDKVRPISLASCILKILEKLIKERLQWWLEKNDILSKTEFGFRENKSCIENLNILVSDIQKNFYTKDTVSALFLDIKGAFDNVVPDILIDDLIELNLPKKIISFIKNVIYERKVTFCTLTEIVEKKVDKGLPQGSVLSPILYSIYARNVDRNLNNSVSMLQFADDIVIYNSKPVIHEEQVKQLEEENSKLLVHLKKRGLEVAPEKCVLIIFDKANFSKKVSILVNDKLIEPSVKTRFLGMILDSHLKWNHHTENLVVRCKNSLKILCFLRFTWWGANPETLLTLYKSLIRSKIDYGGFLMFPSDSKIIDKLQKVQNIGIRLAMGYRNSSPINVMTTESKIPYLKCRLKLVCYKFLLRCLANDQSLLLNNLEKLVEFSDNFRYSHNFSPPLTMECYLNI
ncbi:hypothetical protein TKK_0010168 [Trichogramma kaykai]